MTKHNTVKLLLAIFLLGYGFMQLHAQELKTGAFVFGKGKKGYLFLPDNFKAGGNFKFILFMHGRGAHPGKAGNFGSVPFEKFRKLCAAKGYVVAVPPLRSNWYNDRSERDVEAMLDFLAAKLKLDLRRFHVMGCSMGGLSGLLYAGRHPERVLSICDIFGAIDMEYFSRGEYRENIKAAYGGYYNERKYFYESRSPLNYVSVLKNIPILVIHGDKDEKVPFAQSVQLVDEIKKYGGKQIELIKVPKVGHNNAVIKGLEEKILNFMAQYE